MDSRALIVIAGLIAAPAAAIADGLPQPPPPPLAATYCCEQARPVWSGLYIGTNIGGIWSDPNWRFPFAEAFNTTPGQSFSSSDGEWIWGGHLGLNYQVHRFVIGAEVSYEESAAKFRSQAPSQRPPLISSSLGPRTSSLRLGGLA
jgi:hypothetical protein